VRARERPTASTPVEWEELEAALEAKDSGALDFTVDDLRARITAKGDLYAPLLTQRQELPDLSG
jgi:bifunctional non-homologous end joining protein LigD